MDNMEIVITAMSIILCVIMLAYYSKCKYKLRKLILGCGSGIASLYFAHFIFNSMGGGLSINLFTCMISAALGIPGTVMLVLIRLVK